MDPDTTTQPTPRPVEQKQPLALAVRVAVPIALGFAVGVATSILQTHLERPWAGLVNAASPWLIAAFVVGLMHRRPTAAAIAGGAVTLVELVGYYATSHLRGFGVGSGILIFWGACAVVGGPVFGAAGSVHRHRSDRWADLGGVVLPAAFMAEGAIQYGAILHYNSSAVLFVAIGLVIAGVIAWSGRGLVAVVKAMALLLPLAVASELLLHLIYDHSF